MDEQNSRPIFTGRPPGKKNLPGYLKPSIDLPVAKENPEAEVVVEVPPLVELQPIVAAPPVIADQRRHIKTLLGAAALAATFGVTFGAALATAVKSWL